MLSKESPSTDRYRVTDLINEGKWLWVAVNAINHNWIAFTYTRSLSTSLSRPSVSNAPHNVIVSASITQTPSVHFGAMTKFNGQFTIFFNRNVLILIRVIWSQFSMNNSFCSFIICGFVQQTDLIELLWWFMLKLMFAVNTEARS